MEELIIRVLEGRASPAEMARMHAWRRESPANESLYRDLSTIWAGLPDVEIETAPPPGSAIRRLAESPATIPIDSRRRQSRRGWIASAAIAASIALLVANVDLPRRQSLQEGPVLQIQQLATDASETYMTQLSDGTIVYLAPNSSLQVVATPGSREVWLEGRAFFGVAKHGDDWPFVVRSDRGSVHVHGTRFEFSTEDEETRVVVVDGRVDFALAGESIELLAGQMSIPGDAGQPVRIEGVDVTAMLDWMGQALVFEDTPLRQAAREIEIRYGAVLELRGEELDRQTISGGFRNRTFGEVVSAICQVLAAECSIADTHAVISAPSSELVRPGAAVNSN